MSIHAALAATAALSFTAGWLSARPTIRTLQAQVDLLEVRLRAAQHVAGHDRLTGLPNRTSAEQLFNVRELLGAATTVALVDLDGFKRTNDTYGHHAGDDLLRAVAERLAVAAKAHGGMAARLAGDEFLLLLPTNGDEPAKPVATILNLVAEPAILRTDDGHITLHPTASAGIAVYDGIYGTFGAMLHHADIALYHAKRHPGSHRTYHPEMRMPRNSGRHGPRRRDQRPADGRFDGEVTP
ncbi:GGDEF domain-containing protein [Micromonospora sp. CPCC 206061]|uniref:GGDEF domain-containing protein n=1 Tax=Micromonospora sp. CPCC 206061 TaxID=3122410 RepID=UPI002FF0D61E